MKTLPAILHDVMILLANPGVERVEIARGNQDPLDGRSSVFQIRLRLDEDMGLLCEARSWLGEQWGPWRDHEGWLGGAGFDVRDVLAIDWRIISHQLTSDECDANVHRTAHNQAKATAHEVYSAAGRLLGLLDERTETAWIKLAEALREQAWTLYQELAHDTEW